MNYTYQMLAAEVVTEDDEIDALFCQLQPIAPPSTLVGDILAAATRLPLPVQRTTRKTWEDFELVTYHVENNFS